MSPATLESPALEFDFDTLGLDLLALDSTDDQPGDQGNELASRCPTITDREFIENGGEVFTTEYLYTLEDDEQSLNMPDWAANALKPVPAPAPAALEAEPLRPLQLPASIPAAMEAALESPAIESPEPDCAPGRNASAAPAPCGFLTRRQELTEEINALESQVVEYSETEYELAEKVSQVRKWRKEALEQLRALKWQLNAMSDEDAEKPVASAAVSSSHKPCGIATNPVADNQAPIDPTIDHGGAQSLTALGVTPKQLEKFEIEGIRTVSQFERALADRSIENVRGIQERTMDKMREALWEFRKQHPIPDPDDRPVLTASERDAKIEPAEEQATQMSDQEAEQCAEDMNAVIHLATMSATESRPSPTPDQPAPSGPTKPSAIIGSINLAIDLMNASLAQVIIQAGRDARTAGFERVDNPLQTGSTVHREELWNDGWDEMDQELKAKSATQAAAAEKPEKPARKPRAKKAKAEAGSEATDGTEATKSE